MAQPVESPEVSVNAASKDTWSASTYNNTASFVYSPAFTSVVLSLLDAKPGEKIIDIGCGSGEVTREIQRLVGAAGLVVGMDSSESMVSQCKQNGLEHAFVGDAQDFEVPADFPGHLRGGFDAVFSNAALHWCKRKPEGVLTCARRILKPGGRFVIEMGGLMNCVGVRATLHKVLRTKGYNPDELDPWYFPSIEDYRELLESAGFEVQHISLNPRITPLNGQLIDWLRLFCRPHFLAEMADEEAEEIMSTVQDICRIDCMDSRGRWTMMYTRLRVVAILKSAP